MGTLESGKSFGKYRILRQIGRGGMGVVYLAEDQVLGRQVALKVLDRSITSRDEFERRFHREARTVASLNHPNIVQIHNLEKVGEDWAIDMAYADGGSLADAAATGALTVHDALSLIRDMLDALATCHEVGVVHRDVKPNNILISSDGRALLSDFGLAALLAEHHSAAMVSGSSSGLFVGTPRYAPPESWNEHEPTPAWDVYSVGMVIFEMIAGRTPYDAGSPYALMRQMAERPVPRLADVAKSVSAELSDLVAAMLDHDPAQRPQNAREALERLDHVPEIDLDKVREAPTVIRQRVRTKTQTRSRRLKRNVPSRLRLNPWLAIAGATIALSLFVLGILSRMWTPNPIIPVGAKTAQKAGEADRASMTPPTQPCVFTTVNTLTHEIRPNHWLMIPDKKPNEWVVLASESTHVWYLKGLVKNEVAWTFHGYWAEYTDDTARYFQHGEATGKGRWIEVGREMTVSLDFQTVDLGTRWSLSLVLKLPEDNMTEGEFVRKLQTNEFALPMLYNEVFARNLPWAEAVETQFLVLASDRAMVPVLRKEAPPIQLDGRLDEPAWQVAAEGRNYEAGVLLSRPRESQGKLLVRRDEKALFIGIETSKPMVNPRAVLVILERLGIPVNKSERWSARIQDQTIVVSRDPSRGQQQRSRTEWQVGIFSNPSGWQAEVRIPFDALGEKAPPQAGSRWRLNAGLYDLSVSEDTPVAMWGADDVNTVEQGTVLVFTDR